ncbi:hypothetical protein N7467_001598 [Penicillium canescens]|nr:hypothetical protein N7467_001598 [Penicillium canescens]
MPICIECSYPVSHLYSAYSRADDRSQGKGVRLTQCPRCQRFADKYVEYDFVVLFIDLVLIKPQVYRHLLFNRLGRDDNRFDRSIIRLGVLLLLFDVYLTWARIEKDPSLAATFLSRAPIIVQYLFFLSLNAAATLAHHLTVRLLASILVPKSRRYSGPDSSNNATTTNTGEATPFPSGPPTPTIRPSPSAVSVTAQTQNQANPLASPPKSTQASGTYSEVTSPIDVQAPPIPPPRPAPPLRRASTAPLQNIQPLPPSNGSKPSSNQHRITSKQLREALPHPTGNLGRRRQRQPLQYSSAQPDSGDNPICVTAGYHAQHSAPESIFRSYKRVFRSLRESSDLVISLCYTGSCFVSRIAACGVGFVFVEFYAD